MLVAPAAAHKPNHAPYTNCTTLNTEYPHGVGRANAHDVTKAATGQQVTAFKRSTKLYSTAMLHNKRLDADKDGVACEKA